MKCGIIVVIDDLEMYRSNPPSFEEGEGHNLADSGFEIVLCDLGIMHMWPSGQDFFQV